MLSDIEGNVIPPIIQTLIPLLEIYIDDQIPLRFS
jgi:hypothetical protein